MAAIEKVTALQFASAMNLHADLDFSAEFGQGRKSK